MRFADSLKAYDPEKQKQELLKVLEDDPRAFAKAIASHAEAAVRRDAAIAAQNKRNSISGYLVYQGMYDADPYYRLEPKAPENTKNTSTNFVLLDKVNISGSNGFVGFTDACSRLYVVNPWFNNLSNVSQKTVERVCVAVREKLEGLGFQHYSIASKKQEFYVGEDQKKLFGGTKKVYRSCGFATILWIEVSW